MFGCTYHVYEYNNDSNYDDIEQQLSAKSNQPCTVHGMRNCTHGLQQPVNLADKLVPCTIVGNYKIDVLVR